MTVRCWREVVVSLREWITLFTECADIETVGWSIRKNLHCSSNYCLMKWHWSRTTLQTFLRLNGWTKACLKQLETLGNLATTPTWNPRFHFCMTEVALWQYSTEDVAQAAVLSGGYNLAPQCPTVSAHSHYRGATDSKFRAPVFVACPEPCISGPAHTHTRTHTHTCTHTRDSSHQMDKAWISNWMWRVFVNGLRLT